MFDVDIQFVVACICLWRLINQIWLLTQTRCGPLTNKPDCTWNVLLVAHSCEQDSQFEWLNVFHVPPVINTLDFVHGFHCMYWFITCSMWWNFQLAEHIMCLIEILPLTVPVHCSNRCLTCSDWAGLEGDSPVLTQCIVSCCKLSTTVEVSANQLDNDPWIWDVLAAASLCPSDLVHSKRV